MLGGLLPDWQSFSDPLNDVTRPAQMGPSWKEVHHLSGMPIDELIWLVDPPQSSYPASVAVKAAELQGRAAGEAYLRRLREAVMLERRNIGRRDVLLVLAAELAGRRELHFDARRFAADLEGAEALDAFREDVRDARFRGIARFPTLLLRIPDGHGVIQIGYRPYPALRAALTRIAPDLGPSRRAEDPVAYAAFWQGITAREAAEAVDVETGAAEVALAALDRAVTAGALTRRGSIYTPA